jgi:hypothetical protein
MGSGLMLVYTTCDTCGDELKLEAAEQNHHHDNCAAPAPTEHERTLEDFKTVIAELMRGVTPEREQRFGTLHDKLIALEDAPPKLGPAAVYYASVYGWPVFPLRPGDKRPATKNGFKDATTDVDRIKAYWTANPTANIGLPTGIKFDVIDVDLPDGPASLERMANVPAVHGLARTSSGGMHLYIEPTGKGNTAGLFPGIDIRGKGGYVVAPPSILGGVRQQWRWINKPSPRIIAGN